MAIIGCHDCDRCNQFVSETAPRLIYDPNKGLIRYDQS
jgi:hypothetical protein